MTSKFDTICENLGAIKTTTKMFYPRKLKLSDNFLHAFQEEYYNQRKTFLEDNKGKNFQPHSERILKALKFHIKELEEAVAQSQQAISRKMGPKMASDIEVKGEIAPKQVSSKKFKNLKLRKQ